MQASNQLNPRAVLGVVKARPGNVEARPNQAQRPALTAPARDAINVLRAGAKERPLIRTKELSHEEYAVT
jgi:hypothetical protein